MTDRIERTNLSVSDHIAGSLMCLHGFLTPSQRKQLPNYPDITNFCQTSTASRISASLISQSIGIQKNEEDIDFYDEIKAKIEKIISQNQFDNWRFYIDGFAHTGKSTIMSFLANEMLHTLVNEKKIENLFFFPINWENSLQRIVDVNSVYIEIVTATMNQLIWQAPRIFPFASSLFSWLLDLPNTGVSPELPSHVKISEQFPTTQIEKIGRNVVSAFKNGPSKINILLETIMSLPMELSFTFGFKNIIYIFDHLDLCNFPFSMENESEHSEANFLDCIVEILKNHNFIISPKNDGIPIDALGNPPAFIDTTSFVSESDLSELQIIQIDNPFLEIKPTMCRGCPQLLHKYKSILTELKSYQKFSDPNLNKFGLVPSGLEYQKKLIIQLVSQFCYDLESIGNEEINEDMVFEMQTSENITFAIKE
ncbi:hypothetical protein TVAG_081910 [Trichomonas vaginalis G3]|uniref:KAP NTPase domain-containing protein n=1 Tax=Trichomonas vaginalis (strain ATCC PRA-98 / G3) TaxID=412133 RepID=A2E6Y3_TRIV3|nr:hypothetical protein TVAGG3_0492810 [Trichomonas vaginalis G3]EAY11619.1 hypothetical protein TVAG_081910 [Trichomonas vaginalis G3]KAI5516500.1 hypothetical protein TVAGG3_0492810 [Trichomonas vaginalis G3]|eukprot:XP_001323842.1 hypothetical protein [Trichomonas vaginalis G3]